MQHDSLQRFSPDQADLPADLLAKIIYKIKKKQRFLALRNAAMVFLLGIVGSGAVFVPTLQALRTALAESGFFEFLSLLFSDSSVIMANWYNFSLALLESLPVTSVAGFFVIILVFLWSLKFMAQYIKIFFSPLTITNN